MLVRSTRGGEGAEARSLPAVQPPAFSAVGGAEGRARAERPSALDSQDRALTEKSYPQNFQMQKTTWKKLLRDKFILFYTLLCAWNSLQQCLFLEWHRYSCLWKNSSFLCHSLHCFMKSREIKRSSFSGDFCKVCCNQNQRQIFTEIFYVIVFWTLIDCLEKFLYFAFYCWVHTDSLCAAVCFAWILNNYKSLLPENLFA